MLRHLRQSGLSLQAIGEAAVALRSRAGRHYPLAWSGLAHDGRDLLVEIAAEGREQGWERIRDSQGGLPGVLRRGSAAIGWSDDGYAANLRLVIYHDIDVIVDPARASGQPLVDGSDVRVEDVVDHARTGTAFRDIAAKFALEDFEVEALIRPHLRPAPTRRPRHPHPQPDPLPANSAGPAATYAHLFARNPLQPAMPARTSRARPAAPPTRSRGSSPLPHALWRAATHACCRPLPSTTATPAAVRQPACREHLSKDLGPPQRRHSVPRRMLAR